MKRGDNLSKGKLEQKINRINQFAFVPLTFVLVGGVDVSAVSDEKGSGHVARRRSQTEDQRLQRASPAY